MMTNRFFYYRLDSTLDLTKFTLFQYKMRGSDKLFKILMSFVGIAIYFYEFTICMYVCQVNIQNHYTFKTHVDW